MDVRGERLNDGLSVVTVGSGPPLVSIPGLGQGVDLSLGVPRPDLLSARAIATSTGRTVHTIARPLDPPREMTISDLAGSYATAIEQRFGGAVDVFGGSAGGVTALQLAIDHPAVVRRLVVAIAASRLGDDGRRRLLEHVRLDGRRFRSAWTGSSLMAHGPMRAALLVWMLALGNRPFAAGERAVVECAQTWDVTGRLGEIAAPTLVLGGTRDALFPAELIEATARGIPGSRLLLLPGRGHVTALFHRGGSRAIADFLNEV